MLDFETVEVKEKKRLEREVFKLDNQVKYWKSLYEREVKKRPVKTQYVTNEQYFDKYYKRTKEILKLMFETNNIQYWQILAKELMEMYGVIEKKQETLLEDLL